MRYGAMALLHGALQFSQDLLKIVWIRLCGSRVLQR